MKEYIVCTKATMEQAYKIHASSVEEAKRIALENTEEFFDQTVVGDSEVLSVMDEDGNEVSEINNGDKE